MRRSEPQSPPWSDGKSSAESKKLPDGKSLGDPSRDRFRQNLSRIMSEQNITQASLARAMEVSRVAVHAWIWGTCFPETSRLIKLAQMLNVTVGDLLETDLGASSAPSETSNEEALLLNAFRKLPNTERLTLLAEAYERSARAALAIERKS